jgi:hypothetical protein
MAGPAAGPDAGGPPAEGDRGGGRERGSYAAALAALASGGVLALAVAQAPWVSATGVGVGYATSFSGSDLAPAVVACALVAIAGAVGVLATRGLARRLVGALLALVGLVLVAGPVQVLADPAGAAQHPLALVTGGAAALPRSASVAWWWCVLAAVGGAAVLAGAALTVVRGSRWPVMAARYDAPVAGRRAGTTGPDVWTLLDRGEDPTLDPAEPPPVDAGEQLAPGGASDPGTAAPPGDLQQ